MKERPRASNRLASLSDGTVRLILVAMTLLALLAALWATRNVNPLRGDSAEYLYFDASRSVGYPAFLEFIRLTTGHVALAVQVQMVLLAGSLLFLGWSFHSLCRRPIWSIAFQLLLLIQAGMWFASAFLMTEALSTALLAAWCAQLLRMLRTPSRGGIAFLVALSALAMMVRPPLIALFLGTGIFVLTTLPARERAKALIMAGAGLVVAWATTPVAQYFVNGSAQTTSPFARGVLQHTLYCDRHGTPPNPDSQFVESEAAPVRRYIESAPADVQEQLRRAYSTPLRFGSMIPVLGGRHHLQMRSDVDPYLAPIAAERMKANPSCYAGSVLSEYLRMAVFATDPTSEEGRRTNAFMAIHPPVEVPQYPVLPGDEWLARKAASEVGNQVAGLNPPRQRLEVVAQVPLLALLPFRLLFAAAALVGLCSLMLLPIRKRFGPTLPVMAAIGAAFHGTLAVTAIVEIGFFRYLVPLWPAVCTMVALPMLIQFEARSAADAANPSAPLGDASLAPAQ